MVLAEEKRTRPSDAKSNSVCSCSCCSSKRSRPPAPPTTKSVPRRVEGRGHPSAARSSTIASERQ
eukprot:1723772-Pyramimonas_sp.AAC.1